MARIVACLINEAATLVQQKISSRDEVEIAAHSGDDVKALLSAFDKVWNTVTPGVA